ncbi:carbohydrate ABC transporter permease [Kineococcus sp. SYSU DK002]|uniref:carbohydrate ABC transporter permease n=1 Tax=Kineococcus sp. SYSU DK002 TaxID=3383123 RepID=UPI003D7D5D43
MASAVAARPPVRAPRRGAGLHEREGRAGYVLVAPTTVLLAIFYLYPLAQTVVFSFTDWNPASPEVPSAVGLDNYAALTDTGGFLSALGHTGLYVLVVVPVSMAVGLFLAALLNTPFRGRSVYRALIFTPYIAPTVGSALIFTYLLTPLGGLVNSVVELFGARPIAFLTTTPWAMVSVLVFSIWQQVGYMMVIYSAALSGIPSSYHEAATIDGAGAVRRFFSISLPLLAPTSGFLAITGIVGALQVFTQVYVLTGGGPLGSTSTVIHWIYQQGFVFFNGGLATAASVVLLLIGIAVTLVQLLVLNRRDTVELS